MHRKKFQANEACKQGGVATFISYKTNFKQKLEDIRSLHVD
jgi:hypothetical protein